MSARPLDSGRTDSLGRTVKVSESAAAGRADAPPPAAPQPLSREAGVDYGDAAPRDADGNLVDLSNDLNFGVRASSPYDRGEPFNDEDYVYETDEWSIGHGANGSFEVDGRGRTSAYLPVLAGGAKSPKVTSMARWRIDCYDEAKAGRIWRNRGVISRLVTSSRP